MSENYSFNSANKKKVDTYTSEPLVNPQAALDLANRAGWHVRHARADKSDWWHTFIAGPARKLLEHYRNDPWFRATMSLQFSGTINTIFVFYQAYNAFARSSFWFGSLAFYYALLTGMRVMMVGYMQSDASDGREELRRYRNCGVYLLVLTMVVMIMGMVVNRVGHRPIYPGHMVWVSLAFTGYNVILAIVNYVKYRKLEDPLVSASKALSIAAALVSLYSFQCAVIGRFAPLSDRKLVTLLNNLTPALVLIAITGMALFIIVRVTWVLKAVGND